MISVKQTTKAFSSAPQVSSLEGDRAQNLSVQDKQKALGDKDIGQVLNEIADPNWVDPAKMRKVGNADLDKDAFFRLMLTQMKNQDPTNPLKSHEMAAQLAQFTSLEKLTNINSTLEEMKRAQDPSFNAQALQYIGRAVKGDSSRIIRSSEDQVHEVPFELANEAQEVKLKIVNAQGDTVKEVTLRDLKPGKNSFTWNGVADTGQTTNIGDYSVYLEAVGKNGRGVAVETKFEGVVSGVNFTPKGPVFLVGSKTVKASDIETIVDTKLAEANSGVKAAATATATSEPSSTAATPATAATSTAPSSKPRLQNVPMSRELKNQIDKVTQ